MTLDQQPMNAIRSKAWAPAGQSTHLTEQSPFIVGPPRLVTLGTTWLVEHAAGATLRHLLWPQTATHLGDRSPTSFGAYQFPFAASFKISMSSACSATIFFSRAFSFCRAFSSLVISGAMPPYF